MTDKTDWIKLERSLQGEEAGNIAVGFLFSIGQEVYNTLTKQNAIVEYRSYQETITVKYNEYKLIYNVDGSITSDIVEEKWLQNGPNTTVE